MSEVSWSFGVVSTEEEGFHQSQDIPPVDRSAVTIEKWEGFTVA